MNLTITFDDTKWSDATSLSKLIHVLGAMKKEMYGKLFSPMWNLDNLWRRPAYRPADWQVNLRLENRHACRDSANAWHPAWYISRCRRICPPKARHPPGPMLAGHFSSIPARPLDTRAESESFPDNRRCNLPFLCLRSFQFSSILIIVNAWEECAWISTSAGMMRSVSRPDLRANGLWIVLSNGCLWMPRKS